MIISYNFIFFKVIEMIKKISSIFIILIFSTGFAYAAQNINDLQIPNDFSGKKSEGDCPLFNFLLN